MIFQYTMPAIKSGKKTTTLIKMADGDVISEGTMDGVPYCMWLTHRPKTKQKWWAKMQVGRRYSIQAGRWQRAIGSFVCAGLREIVNPMKHSEELFKADGFNNRAHFLVSFLEIHPHDATGRFCLVDMSEIRFYDGAK